MARTSRNNMKNSSFFHIMVQGINNHAHMLVQIQVMLLIVIKSIIE